MAGAHAVLKHVETVAKPFMELDCTGAGHKTCPIDNRFANTTRGQFGVQTEFPYLFGAITYKTSLTLALTLIDRGLRLAGFRLRGWLVYFSRAT